MSSSIIVSAAPRAVDPDIVTSYFPTQGNLTAWNDARKIVPGHDRMEIPVNSQVAVLVEVKVDKNDKPYMTVANASCAGDSFWLHGYTREDEAMLRRYAGMMVAATVVIHQRLGDQWCHGSRYSVHTDRLVLATLPYNPTMDELLTMDPGAHFVIQGEFLEYYEVTPGQSQPDTGNTKTRGNLRIRTSTGVVSLDSYRPHMKEPEYNGGVLENLRDKRMIPGEIIRITGFITKGVSDRLDGLPTVGYNHPYLLVPDRQRQDDYDALRYQVSCDIAGLQDYVTEQQWHSARLLFAETRRRELTADESRDLLSIMETVPDDHRSVYCSGRYDSGRLYRAFGIVPEELDREDFVRFATDVATGVLDNPRDQNQRADQSYLFRYWQSSRSILHSDSLTELLLAAIPVRLERLERCSDDFKEYWDDHYFLDRCIEHIGHMESPDPRLVQAVVDLVETCIRKGYFNRLTDTHGNRQCPIRLNDVLTTSLRTLERLTKSQDTTAHALLTREVLSEWRDRLNDAGAIDYVLSDLRKITPQS